MPGVVARSVLTLGLASGVSSLAHAGHPEHVGHPESIDPIEPIEPIDQFAAPWIDGQLAPQAPALDPEDHHSRPAWYDALDNFAIELDPLAAAPEYPLAAAFNAADPSNYVAGGMIDHEYVVVHTMQGSYAGTISWFKNPASNVSTHFVMRSVDGEVTQMVNLADRAWHVGSSNSYAIGIEHEGYIDDPEKWYTWATYTSSARLTRWAADSHAIPLNRDHIVGHVELPNQSHTDPGAGWNWDLYMALILDLVGEGEIRGVVVDRTRGCTLTANKETWLKRTTEPAAKLGAADRCLLPAGAQLRYYWASIDHVGHRRLVMEAGEGPCANQNGLDQEGFVFAADFGPLCDPATMGAAGATVTIDGGEAKGIGADGAFAFPPRSAGLYTLGVAGGDYEAAIEPVDLAVYPGLRAVLIVDPIVPDTTTGDDTGDDTGMTGESGTTGMTSESGGTTGVGGSESDSGGGSEGESASVSDSESASASDSESASGGSSASGGGSASGGSGASDGSSASDGGSSGEDDSATAGGGWNPALPPGYGDEPTDGSCACRSDGEGGASPFAALVLLGLARRRRRGASRPRR